MRKIIVFNMITADGYFEGPGHDLSWHNVNKEFNDDFVLPLFKSVDTLIFGRLTYELMASFWPTDTAKKDDPVVAGLMNDDNKIVFSHSMEAATWEHTTLIHDNAAEELQALKEKPGKDMLILGSSNLCVSLLQSKVIDEVKLIVNPVLLGKGTPIFNGVAGPLRMKLLDTKLFKSENVLLNYAPEYS